MISPEPLRGVSEIHFHAWLLCVPSSKPLGTELTCGIPLIYHKDSVQLKSSSISKIEKNQRLSINEIKYQLCQVEEIAGISPRF